MVEPMVHRDVADDSCVLDVRHLSVSRGGVGVLDDIELSVATAESVAIGGASGSGKSTLLAAIAGLVKPERGEVWIAGERQTHARRRWTRTRLHRIGIVFQADEFLPELTLLENICLPSMLRSGRRRIAEHADAAEILAERLGIAELLDRRVFEVSMGQLQRAAIVRAVLGSPPLILADEPTSALDEHSAREALRLLVGVAGDAGSALCIVTHDPAIAMLCDRRVDLSAGSVAGHPSAAAGHRLG
ncbi:ABC transporter ATP-binding protein [Nocardioides acrostichi]|uniref:ATP-binding cassette domain-containing protein n=1 Tax=Nocardioides acrostichi TaxID=2784339 RepID=A0A930V272_9ACTN|nr:ATP-binding cassette domain-containing protein [Nocardioides acrostichi]MBF4162422.1 ATP-binding cassette domain-containing protein [Nocardioides acrostichi]